MNENIEQRVYDNLKGKYKHYCYDWDGMAIDETYKEFECCTCYDKRRINVTEKTASETTDDKQTK